jgi:hypothetical protein
MANGQQGGGGSGAGYAAMIPQLVGAGLQIATARPTRQERMQRRIAMGAPDPAVEALRRRLATQQLQTAMAAAAGQPGVNPALALRQAQAGLAQSEIGTAERLAAAQARSVEQARASDRVGERRDALLSGVGGMLNILGTGVATQAAGRQLAEQDAAAAQQAALAMEPPQPPTGQTGMAAPAGVEVAPPAGTETTTALPPTVELTMEEAMAEPTEANIPLSPEIAADVDRVAQGFSGAPADVLGPTVIIPENEIQFTPGGAAQAQLASEEQSIADEVEARLRSGMQRVRLPSATTPTGAVPEPTGMSQADRDRIMRQDQLRQSEPGRPSGTLGPESRPVRQVESPAQVRERRVQEVRATLPAPVANDTRNQALIESLADAEDMNDPELVQMIRALMAAESIQ